MYFILFFCFPGGPCLRSKSSRSPPAEVSNAIEVYEPARSASREAWCAAHLNMLCTHALEAYKNFGYDGLKKYFLFLLCIFKKKQ
jgi:hypothetical protein